MTCALLGEESDHSIGTLLYIAKSNMIDLQEKKVGSCCLTLNVIPTVSSMPAKSVILSNYECNISHKNKDRGATLRVVVVVGDTFSPNTSL